MFVDGRQRHPSWFGHDWLRLGAAGHVRGLGVSTWSGLPGQAASGAGGNWRELAAWLLFRISPGKLVSMCVYFS